VMLLAIVLITAVLLIRLQTAHVRRVGTERRAILGRVQDVLDESCVTQQGIDYPVLTGRYRGAPVTVALIVDTVTLRRLPTLWLSITRRQPLPLSGPVDILLRPSTTDIVSPGEQFPTQHRVPSTWPAHIRVATPAGGTLDFSQLAVALPVLREQRTKDVLLTPAGARLVTELARAELGHYRIVKRSKFNADLGTGELVAALDAVCSMTEGLLCGPKA
jgi:hypothetical protein